MPSFLRYGAYPYIVVVREHAADGAGEAIEHRFVGLFTGAAMSANVLEIPLIADRVREALAMSDDDPSHPGQLVLDIIQAIPRPELFALDGDQLLDAGQLGHRSRLAPAHPAVPARRPARTLRVLPGLSAPRPLHHRGPAGHAGHPGSRVRRGQHRLHRPGHRITLGASVFHRPAARGAGRPVDRRRRANRIRIQDLLTEAARTWADRMLAPASGGASAPEVAEHYADGASRGVQAGRQARPRPSPTSARRSAANRFGPAATRARRQRPGRLPDLVPRRLLGIAEPAAADAAVHGRRW